MSAFELMRRVDAAWLHMDRPRNTADIVALLGFARQVPYARIRALIEERLLSNLRFRQRIREGRLGPAWEVDPGFKLDRHLEQVPGGRTEALPEVLGEVATAPLDPAHPPWRIEIVGGRGDEGTALVVKLHHCMGDGHALVGLLCGLADEVPAEAPAPRAFRGLAFAREGWGALARAALDPRAAVRLARDAGAFAASLARMVLRRRDQETILSRPHTGVRRVAWTDGIPLDVLRQAARRAGATVNELVLAALAGALRNVLAGAGEDVDALEPRALVPVNTRSGPAGPALGNAFGLVFLELPVRLPTAPARLAAIRERFAALRRSPDALVTLSLLGAFGLMPSPIEQLGLSFFARRASLVVTNVAGPREPLHLAGERLDRLMFWVPHPATLNVGVSVLSYAGEVRLGVRADTAALPDPGLLAHAFEVELGAFGVAVPAPQPPIVSARAAARKGGGRATMGGSRPGSSSIQGARRSSGPGAPRASRSTPGDQPLSPRGTSARGASDGHIRKKPRRS
jgi:diacylglycerol O-acyltransferase